MGQDDVLEKETNGKGSCLQSLFRWLRMLFSGRNTESNIKEALEEVLEEHLDNDDESSMSSEERDMLLNVLSVGEMTVRDVMIPRADIVAIEDNITLSELKEIFKTKRHTRMPVYKEELDNIVGFLHLKDMVSIFCGDEAFDMDKVVRKVMFVSPSMKIVDLLVEMRLSGEHIAIVVDEYGGTDGIVTMEDLFEEIVGEIQDEHDLDNTPMHKRKLAENIYEIDARYPIDELEEELGVKLMLGDNSDDIDTLGGLIFSHLGRVPARGEILEINNTVRLEVLAADPRRIRRIKVTLVENTEDVE